MIDDCSLCLDKILFIRYFTIPNTFLKHLITTTKKGLFHQPVTNQLLQDSLFSRTHCFPGLIVFQDSGFISGASGHKPVNKELSKTSKYQYWISETSHSINMGSSCAFSHLHTHTHTHTHTSVLQTNRNTNSVCRVKNWETAERATGREERLPVKPPPVSAGKAGRVNGGRERRNRRRRRRNPQPPLKYRETGGAER